MPANQLIGFYVRTTMAFNGLKISHERYIMKNIKIANLSMLVFELLPKILRVTNSGNQGIIFVGS